MDRFNVYTLYNYLLSRYQKFIRRNTSPSRIPSKAKVAMKAKSTVEIEFSSSSWTVRSRGGPEPIDKKQQL